MLHDQRPRAGAARSGRGRLRLSAKQNKKNRTGGTQSSQASARQEKRAQFEQPKSRTGLHLTIAGVALVALIAVAALVM